MSQHVSIPAGTRVFACLHRPIQVALVYPPSPAVLLCAACVLARARGAKVLTHGHELPEGLIVQSLKAEIEVV